MKAYLLTVIWAAVAGTLAELMGDDEGGGGKILRLFTGLMILSVVVSPLRGLLAGGADAWIDRLRGVYDDARADAAEAEIYARHTLAFIREMGESEGAAAVANLVAENFFLSEDSCRAEVELVEHEGEFSLSAVRIILSGRGALTDPYAVEAYLKDLLGCDVIHC